MIKGSHHTKESNKKRSESLMGKKRPPFSEEWKRNLSNAHKGQIAWNKGKKMSLEYREKLRKSHLGFIPSPETLMKKSIAMTGAKHHNWKGGITPLNLKIRHCFLYRQWRSDIFTRDDFTCQECGQRGSKLHAHHNKQSFKYIMAINNIKTLDQAENCEELWNINNGITYCDRCHWEKHGSNHITK